MFDAIQMGTHNIHVHGCLYKELGKSTLAVILRLQGPVVQSIVSLTSLLRVISLTVLADSIHNILIFFAEKM